MFSNEEKYLTQQEKEQIFIRNGSVMLKSPQLQYSQNLTKLVSLIKMPISLFQLDNMKDFNLEEEDSHLKTTMGVPFVPSQFMASQQGSLSSLKPDQLLGSVQTQTEDFTFMNQLFEEARIYEIPVEMQVEERDYDSQEQKGVDQEQKGVQTQINKFQTVQYKLQLLQKAAVLRSDQLVMNSGVLSISVGSYEFDRGKEDRKDHAKLQIPNQNHQHGDQQLLYSDFLQEEQHSQELLLENRPTHDNNDLFQTANFQQLSNHPDFYSGSSPQKFYLSRDQGFPDTNPIRVSEADINMMQNKHFPQTKIYEEEYEDLQRRFYILEQENSEKYMEIEVLSKKVDHLVRELNNFEHANNQKSKLQQNCLKLQTQLNLKTQQLQTLQQTLFSTQKQINKLHQSTQQKQLQLQQILQAKQKQFQLLQNELNSYRQLLVSGQENYTKKNQALENFISEKEQEISDMKAQHDRKYELYIVSIKEMKEKIRNYQIKIEELENQIVHKDARISQYKEDYSRIREENCLLYKRIENLKEQYSRSQSILDVSGKNQKVPQSGIIYQNNFTKSMTKQNAHLDHKQRNNKIKQRNQQIALNFIIDTSKQEINNFSNQNDTKTEDFYQNDYNLDDNQNSEIKKQTTKAKHLLPNITSSIPNCPQSKINQKPSKIQNPAQLSSLKPFNMHISESSLENSLESEENSESNMRQQQGTISISESHQFSKFASYSFQKPSQIENLQSKNVYHSDDYSHELERIVLIYEGVIEKQIKTIEELEEKVLEFLKDALSKESETEFLYSQLCQYENNLNGLMVQKLDMELQNQRLNKIITESENKLVMLGSRLIKLAKYNSSLS